MKKVLLILLLCLVLCGGTTTCVIVQPQSTGGGEAPAASGFVGTQAAQTGTRVACGRSSYFSEFVPTTAGPVTYIFFDKNEPNGNELIMDYSKFVLWNSSGDVLASSSTCGGTNVSGDIYRQTLSASYTLVADTTYWLGVMTGDAGWYYQPSGTDGNVFGDDTLLASGECPSTANITKDTTTATTGKLRIWCSNDPDDY